MSFKNLITKKMIKNEKGMTLLEIMVVLAILGGLITILASQVMGRLKKAKISEAKIQISEVSKSLEMFYTDCGFFPETLESLLQPDSSCSNWGPDPYMKKMPKDPWNGDYVYEVDGGSFVLVTLGEDKRDGGTGTNADISSEDL